jgi:quercetin dioxygenase-like cupin family protein
MESHDMKNALQNLEQLRMTPEVTQKQAMAAIHSFGTFNGCMLGITRFSGLTPWERHTEDDELLHVLEGEVEITVLSDTGMDAVAAAAGSVVVVPRGLWHRQHARTGVSLMFVTGATDVSWTDDPRTIT